MNKRISSRAVIIEGDKLLCMFRRKIKDDGSMKEYYVIPGGGQEEGETLKENVLREINEEFNVKCEILGYLGSEEHETSMDYYFHCKLVEGEPKVSGEELERMTESNYYEVRYVNLEDIESTDINGKEMINRAINKQYETLDN